MKHVLFFLLATGLYLSGFAQTDSTQPHIQISGYGDIYYRYNFNKNATDNKTSFTNSQNAFELGMASVKFQGQYQKAGFVADLGFGRREQEFAYHDEGIVAAVKQLYVDYAFSDHFMLTMGSFATHMGWELVDPTGNVNYSMSYCFSYGPFFHTGLKADLNFGKWTAMVGVFDPTDYKTSFYEKYSGMINNRKNIGAQVTFAPVQMVKIYLNYLEGKDSSGTVNHQIDPIFTWQLTPQLNVVLCEYFSLYKVPAASTQNWTSSALYLNYTFTPHFGLALRSEYFTDKDGVIAFSDADPVTYSGGTNIWSFTLSGNIHLGQLTVIPEFRVDHADQTIFNKPDGAPTQSTASVLVGAYYSF